MSTTINRIGITFAAATIALFAGINGLRAQEQTSMFADADGLEPPDAGIAYEIPVNPKTMAQQYPLWPQLEALLSDPSGMNAPDEGFAYALPVPAEGFAEVLTDAGWRAVTRDGVQSGEGAMDYDLDMPPYVQEMADWLDDDGKTHPCSFESAYKGFEIMMALCRSAVNGGQVTLPLKEGGDELKDMQSGIPDAKVILSFPESAEEYGE